MRARTHELAARRRARSAALRQLYPARKPTSAIRITGPGLRPENPELLGCFATALIRRQGCGRPHHRQRPPTACVEKPAVPVPGEAQTHGTPGTQAAAPAARRDDTGVRASADAAPRTGRPRPQIKRPPNAHRVVAPPETNTNLPSGLTALAGSPPRPVRANLHDGAGLRRHPTCRCACRSSRRLTMCLASRSC